MIADSVPWREELSKSAIRLRRWDTQRRWTSRTYFLAERDIMMGAYSIRRLIESGKSSSSLPSKRLRTRRYSLVDRTPRLLDRSSPEQFYDFDHPTIAELGVARLCNQLIHSFVFHIYLEDDFTTSIVFVSDRDRGKHLHGVTFKAVADLFDYVGREDIVDHSGTMIAGKPESRNISNHDAVESGRASYSDGTRVFIDWKPEAIPAFDQRILDMVANRIAELNESRSL